MIFFGLSVYYVHKYFYMILIFVACMVSWPCCFPQTTHKKKGSYSVNLGQISVSFKFLYQSISKSTPNILRVNHATPSCFDYCLQIQIYVKLWKKAISISFCLPRWGWELFDKWTIKFGKILLWHSRRHELLVSDQRMTYIFHLLQQLQMYCVSQQRLYFLIQLWFIFKSILICDCMYCKMVHNEVICVWKKAFITEVGRSTANSIKVDIDN